MLAPALPAVVYGALKRGDNTKQTGYVGWQPANAVTFVDNHDTGSNQIHWALNGSKVYLAYVLMLRFLIYSRIT